MHTDNNIWSRLISVNCSSPYNLKRTSLNDQTLVEGNSHCQLLISRTLLPHHHDLRPEFLKLPNAISEAQYPVTGRLSSSKYGTGTNFVNRARYDTNHLRCGPCFDIVAPIRDSQRSNSACTLASGILPTYSCRRCRRMQAPAAEWENSPRINITYSKARIRYAWSISLSCEASVRVVGNDKNLCPIQYISSANDSGSNKMNCLWEEW